MFNLSKKKINKIMAFAIAFTMLFASQVTAFAATTSSKTVTSSKAMSAIQTFDIVDMPTYGGVNLFGTAYQTYTCDLRNAFPSTTAIININLSDSFSKGTCSHLSKYMSAGGRTYYNTPGDNAIKSITNASIGQLWTFGAKCSQNTHSGVHWSGRINGKFKCIMEPYPGNELDF